MGPNDKKRARKAKKQNVREERIRQDKVKHANGPQSPPVLHDYISHMSNTLEFRRNFRQTCSECDSPNIVWSTVGNLAVNGSQKVRAATKELLPIFGASAQAWACSDCDGLGAFEQSLGID